MQSRLNTTGVALALALLAIGSSRAYGDFMIAMPAADDGPFFMSEESSFGGSESAPEELPVRNVAIVDRVELEYGRGGSLGAGGMSSESEVSGNPGTALVSGPIEIPQDHSTSGRQGSADRIRLPLSAGGGIFRPPRAKWH